ncbi:hypothetical protein KUCAC02_031628, partial [Chaenocephalus aceratus]
DTVAQLWETQSPLPCSLATNTIINNNTTPTAGGNEQGKPVGVSGDAFACSAIPAGPPSLNASTGLCQLLCVGHKGSSRSERPPVAVNRPVCPTARWSVPTLLPHVTFCSGSQVEKIAQMDVKHFGHAAESARGHTSSVSASTSHVPMA